ncbi:MAG: hypothetical protein OEL57_09405 [Trichlorobacter sp.]|uniref:hypothetical protein n=1 Tax=Trichlorobacter sp. TaxID=2911007 RepID=UPI00255DBE7C|nr:hypothetical protein [Trichlorobacter sp.]MDK9718107.1 hypothetical protein [Trichlorobacter sp.]
MKILLGMRDFQGTKCFLPQENAKNGKKITICDLVKALQLGLVKRVKIFPEEMFRLGG